MNENDATATDEIAFGDNDALAAHVALLVRARLLVLLTEVEGVFTRAPGTPGAELVGDGSAIGEATLGEPSRLGRGGMRSTVLAARMAAAGGIPTVIAAGGGASVLEPILVGEPRGTRFHGDGQELSAYKVWLRFGRPVVGRIHVDVGARRAVAEESGSLLAVGAVSCESSFQAGDAVELVGPDGAVFAKGLAGADATEIARGPWCESRISHPSSGSARPIPRTACQMRSSFSTSAKRTWPSPPGSEVLTRAHGHLRLSRKLEGELERAQCSAVGIRNRHLEAGPKDEFIGVSGSVPVELTRHSECSTGRGSQVRWLRRDLRRTAEAMNARCVARDETSPTAPCPATTTFGGRISTPPSARIHAFPSTSVSSGGKKGKIGKQPSSTRSPAKNTRASSTMTIWSPSVWGNAHLLQAHRSSTEVEDGRTVVGHIALDEDDADKSLCDVWAIGTEHQAGRTSTHVSLS